MRGQEYREMESEGPAIGIDLGTTHCCLGVWRNGKVEIIPNGQGNRTTPSVVSFTDAECLVGDQARSRNAGDPNSTVFDARRLIGRKFSDPIVQSDMKFWSFNVVVGIGDKPMMEVQYKNQQKQLSAQDISSMILANPREMAEAYLGAKVTNAVLTVPAHFSNAQRLATRRAGTTAGFNVMRILSEPTAAAIAYGLDERVSSRAGNKNVLIFDLGGGTFDVSLLNVATGALKVIATAGDGHLGGEDFDTRLVNYCAREFKKRHGKDMQRDARAFRRLRTGCEKAKRVLSYQVDALIDVDCLHDGVDFQITVNAAKFEELNMDLFVNSMELVDQCLRDANLGKRSVHEVVLVGGSARIRKIQGLLQESFPRSKICKGINPDEAITCGAAIHAAVMRGESSITFEDIVVQDVTPSSVGLAISGGLMRVIIPKNTLIPVKRSKNFTNSYDGQDVIKFTVMEAEKVMARDNNVLGDFVLLELPPPAKLTVKVSVRFEINVDGILVVSALHPASMVRSELTIVRDDSVGEASSDGRLDVYEQARMMDDPKKRLQSYVETLKQAIRSKEMKKALTCAQRRAVKREVGKVLMWLRMNPSASWEDVDGKITELEMNWSLILSHAAWRCWGYGLLGPQGSFHK